MSRIKIKDNSRVPKESLSGISRLTAKIADKTLEQLEKEGVFIFPERLHEADDITRDQMVLQSVNSDYQTGNVMGFLGIGNERLDIESRFSLGERDYLFQYLLEQVFEVPNIVDLETDASSSGRGFHLLLYVFPHYLRSAMRKGVYKTYVRNTYNDYNVKGTIDIARHITANTPFTGNVAYSQRDYSFDNDMMELIRHTIEFIRNKPFGAKILAQIKDEVKNVVAATPSYDFGNMRKVIDANKSNVIRHAFYREYRELQYLCLLILQHRKHQIGFGSRRIYGLLFDGAWLWEEYINNLIGDIFDHPKNKARLGAQHLFAGNTGLIYPDFISCNCERRMIADAKYKPIENIRNRDYLQVLAYMYRFDAKEGFFFFPETRQVNSTPLYLNKGSTYENNVEPRDNIRLTKHGLKIPNDVGTYDEFVAQMKSSEQAFRAVILEYT